MALNLHVKLKHEGGNKTERERLAVYNWINLIQREIVQSQLKGEDVPHNNLQFPPGYLEVRIIFNIHLEPEEIDAPGEHILCKLI